jgi:plasmid stabilization system protein ParE
MALKVKVTRRALAEAYKTYEWLAKQSGVAAARWLQRLFETIETLKTDAQRYPLAEESPQFKVEIREMLVGKRRNVHRVLFTIRESTVVVLFIRHSARGPVEPPGAELDL